MFNFSPKTHIPALMEEDPGQYLHEYQTAKSIKTAIADLSLFSTNLG